MNSVSKKGSHVSKKSKVLLIGINYYPELTGNGPYTTDLAQNLSDLGHDVEVITGFPHYPHWKLSNGKKPWKKKEVIKNVHLTRLKHYVPKSDTILRRFLYEISFAIRASGVVLYKRCDIVIVISPTLFSVFAGLIMKRRGSHLKILVQDIVSSGLSLKGTYTLALLRKLAVRLEAWLIDKADSVGIVSDAFCHELQRMGVADSKLTLTENYPHLHVTPRDYIVDRKKWRWPLENFVVLHTGNMGRKQGLENVIRAAKILESCERRICFVLVGDGNQRRKLEKMSQDSKNVFFMDLVPDTEYSSLLSAANLLLVHESNKVEVMSLPSKLLSYQAAQRPILAVCPLTSPTYNQAIRVGAKHLLPDDPDDLASMILTTANESENKLEMGKATGNIKARVNWALQWE